MSSDHTPLRQPALPIRRQQLRPTLGPTLGRRVPPPQRITLLPGLHQLRVRRCRRIGYHDDTLPRRSSRIYEASEATLTDVWLPRSDGKSQAAPWPLR